MEKLIITCPENFREEREYLFSWIFSDYFKVPYDLLFQSNINYCIIGISENPIKRIFLRDILFSSHFDRQLSPQRPLKFIALPRPFSELLSISIPLIYTFSNTSTHFKIEENTITFNWDILGSIFFQLARLEELNTSVHDEHGRYCGKKSLAYMEGYHTLPLADYYVEILGIAFDLLFGIKLSRKSTFQICISHDVDHPFYYSSPAPFSARIRALAKLLLSGAPWATFCAFFSWMTGIRNIDPTNTHAYFLSSERELGIVSEYNFFGDKGIHSLDGNYASHDTAIVELMQTVVAQGGKIGIHPSYETFSSFDLLQHEVSALKTTLENQGLSTSYLGGRQHFLRWRCPTTWNNWEKAGLSFDSSLGFHDLVGFRAGTAHEYYAYDVLQHRRLKLIERPLIVMDQALCNTKYLGLNRNQAINVIHQLVNECKKVHGTFSILWHNTSIVSIWDKMFYCEILENLKNARNSNPS